MVSSRLYNRIIFNEWSISNMNLKVVMSKIGFNRKNQMNQRRRKILNANKSKLVQY